MVEDPMALLTISGGSPCDPRREQGADVTSTGRRSSAAAVA